jgi:hypothetical protein
MQDLAAFYCNAGVSLVVAQRYEDAEAAFHASLRENPGHARARWGLAHALLGMGRYAEGWPHLRSRFELFSPLVKPPAKDRPEWRGEPIADATVLVMLEQGFGDQIMLARFLPQLRAQGARVMLAIRPELARLLSPLADHTVPLAPGQGTTVPRYDCWTHLFSLPELLGTRLETVPCAPYLEAPAGAAVRAPPRGRIGLVWRTEDPERSLPEELARRLLDRGLVSLQPQDTGAGDFAESAAMIAGLDLVVTIDTATAHLAGALGKPVWILLPGRKVDWRWLRERSDSPWYPTARLFRQGAVGGWDAVVAQVEAELPGAVRGAPPA